MKKEYVSPRITEVNVETTHMLAASIKLGDERVTLDKAWSNGNRGEWGDLWSK